MADERRGPAPPAATAPDPAWHRTGPGRGADSRVAGGPAQPVVPSSTGSSVSAAGADAPVAGAGRRRAASRVATGSV